MLLAPLGLAEATSAQQAETQASCSPHFSVPACAPWRIRLAGQRTLLVGAQQEAGTFCKYVLPTGSVHGRASGLGAEACAGKGAPRTNPLILP